MANTDGLYEHGELLPNRIEGGCILETRAHSRTTSECDHSASLVHPARFDHQASVAHAAE